MAAGLRGSTGKMGKTPGLLSHIQRGAFGNIQKNRGGGQAGPLSVDRLDESTSPHKINPVSSTNLAWGLI